MFSTIYLTAATAAFSLITSSSATYNLASKANVAMYWGAGSNQARLSTYCDQANVDIIPLAFINQFQSTANGLVGEDFGNQCWGTPVYPGPGYDGIINVTANYLPENCPDLQDDIYYCQTETNTKILLSLGGAPTYDEPAYGLNTVQDGIDLATFLWYAYGPYNSSYVEAGGLRPLDRGSSNTNTSMTIDIDGFDFDIETNSPDEQLGYVAAINTLRSLINVYKASNPCAKDYIISGAPQCPIPDQHMATIINQAAFDIIWVQFYNNDGYGCSAINYTTQGSSSNFNLNSGATNWVSTLASGASKNAKLYIGLPGGPEGVANNPQDWLTPAEAQALINEFQDTTNFGGVMLWEATAAAAVQMDNYAGYTQHAFYWDAIKAFLNPYAPATTAATSICLSSTSTSSSSTSTSQSSTLTTSSSSLTSSSSSSTIKSTSSTTTSSSSSLIPTSTSTSTSSSSSSSVVSSRTSSTSPTSTACSPAGWTSLGCYTDDAAARALPAFEVWTINGSDYTIEACQSACLAAGYTLAGLEYADQCFCDNSIHNSANPYPGGCNMACTGDANEICGGSDAINIYSYSNKNVCSTSSSSAVGSSTVSSSSSLVTPTTSSSLSLSTSSSVISSTSSLVSSTSSTSSLVSSSSSVLSSSSLVSGSSSTVPTSNSVSQSSSVSLTSSSVVSITPTSSLSASSSSGTVTSVSSSSSSGSVIISSSSSSGSVTSTSSNPSSSSVLSSSSVNGTVTSVSSTSSLAPTSSVSRSVTSVSSTSSLLPTSSVGGTITSIGSSSSSISTLPSFSNSSSTLGPSSSSKKSRTKCSSVFPSSSSKAAVSLTSSAAGAVTSLPSSSSSPVGPTSSGSGAPASSSTTQYTTSTVFTTSVYTITSCAPTVTNCPARVGQVTTETIELYTTICPVTETQTNGGIPTTTFSSMAPPPTQYTTSTVYTTSIYTITSCAATVTDCPARLGSVTTEVIKLYTTVCPVAEAAATATSSPAVSSPAPAGPVNVVGAQVSPSPSASSSILYTTLSGTTTLYKTVLLKVSTATVVALPPTTVVAPYPTGSGSSSASGSGIFATGLPSVSLVFNKEVTSTAAGVAATTSPITPVVTTSKFTGAASVSRTVSGIMLAVVVGVVALLV